MTPRIYKRKGQGALISYAITGSPLGYLLLAATEKSNCSNWKEQVFNEKPVTLDCIKTRP